jgi:RNA polymerase sigma-70 factor (ECF subfamily)
MTTDDYELIVREHQGLVFSIAYNFLRNHAIAEEVAQEVFLQLYENRRSVDPGSHCVSWLRRTVIHRSIDVSRRSSAKREIQLDELPEMPSSYSESDPLLQDRLGRLIASLPETPRAVLILRYAQDMDVNEIGEILGMPGRTVWSHLQRTIALLRDKADSFLKENRNEQQLRARSS